MDLYQVLSFYNGSRACIMMKRAMCAFLSLASDVSGLLIHIGQMHVCNLNMQDMLCDIPPKSIERDFCANIDLEVISSKRPGSTEIDAG